MQTLFTKNRKRDIILALLLMLCIISFAVIVTVFCKQLYYFDIDYLHISEFSGVSKEIIKKNYDILIQYQSLFYRGELNFPDFVMSESGRIHFIEVKRVFEFIQILFVVTGIISALMVYKNIKEKEYRFLRLTSYFTIGIPLLIGFFASIDFDKAFILFHQIVFRNDFWIFDDRYDPIINILPETFFMHCFFMIIFIVLLISFILYYLYKRQYHHIINQK